LRLEFESDDGKIEGVKESSAWDANNNKRRLESRGFSGDRDRNQHYKDLVAAKGETALMPSLASWGARRSSKATSASSHLLHVE
jgi:hypothetical protein